MKLSITFVAMALAIGASAAKQCLKPSDKKQDMCQQLADGGLISISV